MSISAISLNSSVEKIIPENDLVLIEWDQSNNSMKIDKRYFICDLPSSEIQILHPSLMRVIINVSISSNGQDDGEASSYTIRLFEKDGDDINDVSGVLPEQTVQGKGNIIFDQIISVDKSSVLCVMIKRESGNSIASINPNQSSINLDILKIINK